MYFRSGNPGYQTNAPLLVAENPDWTKGKFCKCVKVDAKPADGVAATGLTFVDDSPAFPAKCQASGSDAEPFCYVEADCPEAKDVDAIKGPVNGKYKDCDAVDDTDAKIQRYAQKVNKNGYFIHEKDINGDCMNFDPAKIYDLNGHPLIFGESAQLTCQFKKNLADLQAYCIDSSARLELTLFKQLESTFQFVSQFGSGNQNNVKDFVKVTWKEDWNKAASA